MNTFKKIKISVISILLISPLIAHGENYYDTLDVSPKSSQEEIKKAYQTQARKYHPDRNPHPQAEERFKQINTAYETLKNPTKRLQYNQSLLLNQQGQIPIFFRIHPTDNPFAHIEEIIRSTTGIPLTNSLFTHIETTMKTTTGTKVMQALAVQLLRRAIAVVKNQTAHHNQTSLLESFNQLQQPLINTVTDTTKGLFDRTLALTLLKELDLYPEILSIINNIANNRQQPRKLRRLAKRIVSQQKKLTTSKCAKTFNK